MKTLPRYSIENIVVALFVVTACVVVILRSMSPLLVNSDASIQIGAALSLLDGEGLGTYILNDDIAQPPKLNPLTWFAPGFSLMLFLLLKVGFSTAIALKLMYAVAAIGGWYGWGLIFRDAMRSQQQSIFSKGVAVLLAILLPLYFTYDWVGTDLMLWAGIPFVIRLFYLSEAPECEKRYVWIGCLVGLLYAFRYAAIFILVAFFLFLIKQNGLIKFGKIVLGFGIFYGAVSLYRVLVKTSVPSQLVWGDFFRTDVWFSKLSEIVKSLGQVKFLFFSHLSHYHIPGSRSLIIVMMLVSASILIWGYPSSEAKNSGNSRIKFILCLNFALVIFLASISFLSSVNFIYLGDQRYYYPLFPSLTLIAYEIGFKLPQIKLNRDGIIKSILLIYLGIFAVSATATFLRAPNRIFGFWEFNPSVDIAKYPSNEIRSRFPESEQKLIEILKQNPQAIAISFAQSFIFSHRPEAVIRQQMLPASAVANVNSRFLSTHTVSKNLQAYLVFGIEGNCKTYCYYTTDEEVELLKQIPPPKLVYRNETEKIRIFSTQLSKGLHFTFSS